MKRMNDNHGIWVNRFYRKWELALTYGYTWATRCYAWIHGVDIGPKCNFMGMALFRRAKFSFIHIGSGCQFRSQQRWSSQIGLTRPCTIQTLRTGARLEIGDSCGFSGAVVAAAELIKIGNGVMCGGNVTITDMDWHHTDPERRNDPDSPSQPVVIGNNVWLGLNVTVLKGVTIGDNTVVGAGSIVTKDLPANVIAYGQPAKARREL